MSVPVVSVLVVTIITAATAAARIASSTTVVTIMPVPESPTVSMMRLILVVPMILDLVANEVPRDRATDRA